MSPKLDPYRTLQVRPDASHDEVKLAFRRLARRYHPDRANDAISNARMIEVNQAWEMLGDPVRRAAYDRAHGIVVRGSRSGGSAAGGSAAGGAGDGDGRSGGADAPSGAGTATSASGPSTSSSGTSTGSGESGGSDAGGSWAPDVGQSAAPPPPRPGGRAIGTVVPFGRYEGWTLAEIGRVEPEYLEWLVRMPIGWQYRGEIGEILAGRAAASAPQPGRGSSPRRRGFLGR